LSKFGIFVCLLGYDYVLKSNVTNASEDLAASIFSMDQA